MKFNPHLYQKQIGIWSDDKELLLEANVISWNPFKKKKDLVRYEIIFRTFLCLDPFIKQKKPKIKTQIWLVYKQINMNEFFLSTI